MNPNILKTAEGIANKYIPDAEKEIQTALEYDILRYLEYHRAKWEQETEQKANFTLYSEQR